jgi:23S rRNA (cytidine1920-2'-O)/16S rRNA (cytidine1409-2'-O)-methyltransferase
MHIPEQADCIVADVSFISLKLVLASALKFARGGGWLVALVKPQFEAGRDNIGKGGIVKDEEVQAKVLEGIVDWLGGQPGWSVIGTMESPVFGGDGNREFLLAARKS